MLVEFRTKKLLRCYEESRTAVRPLGSDVARRYVLRINIIKQAKSFDELEKLSGLDCHPLKGVLRARDIDTRPYVASHLRSALPELRGLTRKNPKEFEPRSKTLLAECGVGVVLLPHLPRTSVHGATFWAAADKAVLMLTIRGKWADMFWFSLFHELAHILLHGKRSTFVEDSDGDPGRKAQTELRSRHYPICQKRYPI